MILRYEDILDYPATRRTDTGLELAKPLGVTLRERLLGA